MAAGSSGTSGVQPGAFRRDPGPGYGLTQSVLQHVCHTGSYLSTGPYWFEEIEEQARDAGPGVPRGFELTGEYLWQAQIDHDRWRDVDPSWNEHLFRGLKQGVAEMTLVYTWHAGCGQTNTEWYTIDLKSSEQIYQLHRRTGVRRRLRIVQWVLPTGMYRPHFPPPVSNYVALEFLEGPSENPVWL